MHAAAASVGLKPLPSPALRRFAWAVLAYFIAVILWGTLVRATGAGAGCGESLAPVQWNRAAALANANTMIEFTHRITSGISFFSAVGLLVWTFAGTVRGSSCAGCIRGLCRFHSGRSHSGRVPRETGTYGAEPVAASRPVSRSASDQYASASGCAHAHGASSQPPTRIHARHDSLGCALRSYRFRSCRADRGRHRLAGRTRRHALSRDVARLRAGAGFLSDQRLAGALALDASNRRIRREHLSDLVAGARRATDSALG